MKKLIEILKRILNALKVPFRISIFNFQFFKNLIWWKKILAAIYTFVLCFGLLLFAININFLWLFGKMPDTDTISNPEYNISTEIYSADSVLLGKYFIEDRTPIKFEELNKNLINALIATEDIRFYKHNGVDFKALGGAILNARGGSTITQQLAKNLFKVRRNTKRGLLERIKPIRIVLIKLKEWIIAFKLEYRYEKNEIIEMYFNTVEFGNQTFGIKTAASRFFQKEPKELDTHEAALLIGLLKAPSYYNPINHPKRATTRRNTVISQMEKYKFLSVDSAKIYTQKPLDVNFKTSSMEEGKAGYFRSSLLILLKDFLEENNLDPYRDGLKIYTTLDSRLQEQAEDAVLFQMANVQRRFYAHWRGRIPWNQKNGQDTTGFIQFHLSRTPRYQQLMAHFKSDTTKVDSAMQIKSQGKVFTWRGQIDTLISPMDSLIHNLTLLQVGFLSMDPYKAEVKAWVGGNDYSMFQYDHVHQMKRQPGSTFKPFVYATAIEQGRGPCDYIIDAPLSHKYIENGVEKLWQPRNADRSYVGNTTLRAAMGRSLNTVAARLTIEVGPKNVAETARRMGISSPMVDTIPSLGLGTNDVSLLEMVTAYCVFLNQGVYQSPRLVTQIIDNEGNSYIPPQEKRQAISAETAFLMTYMLRGSIEEHRGTSQPLWEFNLYNRGKELELGGKTGTSSNYSDGWFIGLSPDLVTGCWVGADDRRIRFSTSQTGEGSKTALPIVGEYLENVFTDKRLGIMPRKFNPPADTLKITKKYNCRTYSPTKVEENDEGFIYLDDLPTETLEE